MTSAAEAGAGLPDDDHFDEAYDGDDEFFDCGETEDGHCIYAGTEWCDFECPYRS
jgi:hypothetical protein